MTHLVPDLAPEGGWTDAARVADIARLRASIDNVDEALVHILAERFKLTTQVGRHKAALDWPTSTKDREAEQVTRLRALAARAGLDPDFEERFLAFIVGEVLVKHGDMRRAGGADAPAPARLTVPTLETERLWLRAWRASDYEPFAAFYADAAASGFIGGPEAPEAVFRRLLALAGHWSIRGHGPFVVEDKATGAFAGYAGPWYPAGWPEPEIAWMTVPTFQRRGYGAEAARRVLAFAYGELGWTTAVSLIKADNIPSRRLAEHLGARLEGEISIFGRSGVVYRHAPPSYRNT